MFSEESKSKSHRHCKERANNNKTTTSDVYSSDVDTESVALVVCHTLAASDTNNWIVDSGATCHMCSDSKLFETLQNLKQPIEVSVGDGRTLQVTGKGKISLKMKLPGDK